MTTPPTTTPPAEGSGFSDCPLRKVTAIVRSVALEDIEKRLHDLRVPGVSVTKVKGYGDYENFFRHDRMTEHVRIEIFLRRERVDEIAHGIIDAAQTGLAGDGIIVVLPVEAVYRIRSGELVTSDDLGGSGHVPRSEVADPGKE